MNMNWKKSEYLAFSAIEFTQDWVSMFRSWLGFSQSKAKYSQKKKKKCF